MILVLNISLIMEPINSGHYFQAIVHFLVKEQFPSMFDLQICNFAWTTSQFIETDLELKNLFGA